MTTELEQATTAMSQPFAALLPADMPELYWTYSESGFGREPRGLSTYSLSPASNRDRLLFNADSVFAVYSKRDWRYESTDDPVDIYTAPITPRVRAWIDAQMPAWWDWDYAMQVLDLGFDLLEVVGHGRLGRFTSRAYGTDTEWSILHMARVWHIPPADITYEPEPRLVWTNRKSRIGERPVTLWTDGKAATEQFYHPNSAYHGQIDLAPAAAKLLAIAVRQRGWRDDDRWKDLLMVAGYETEVLKQDEVSYFGGGGNEKRLERLTTDTGMTLYLVAEEGGAMGEDGDAWDYYSLWVTPARAEAAYAKIEL